MDFLELVKKRRSIRKYKPEPIPEEKIDYILEAARQAPSWGNRQCWRFIVVKDESKKRKIASRDWIAQAPIIIIGCAYPGLSGSKSGQQYYMLDMGIAMEHMMLAAAEQGLGTCWIGGQFDEETVKNILNIPSEVRVVALTPLGYPDESPNPRDRKPLNEFVGYDEW